MSFRLANAAYSSTNRSSAARAARPPGAMLPAVSTRIDGGPRASGRAASWDDGGGSASVVEGGGGRRRGTSAVAVAVVGASDDVAEVVVVVSARTADGLTMRGGAGTDPTCKSSQPRTTVISAERLMTATPARGASRRRLRSSRQAPQPLRPRSGSTRSEEQHGQPGSRGRRSHPHRRR